MLLFTEVCIGEIYALFPLWLSSLARCGYFLKICSSYVSLSKPRFRNMFSSLLDDASWLLAQFHYASLFVRCSGD